MTVTRWHIRDPATLGAALAHIGQAQLPCVVTFKAGEETRRDRQNRMAFEIYKQVAQTLDGHDAGDVRAISKLHIGVPIMREDDAFREKYDMHVLPRTYETKLAFMLEPFDFPVTRIMSVKQMARYITETLAYWDKNGASVMLPEFDQ